MRTRSLLRVLPAVAVLGGLALPATAEAGPARLVADVNPATESSLATNQPAKAARLDGRMLFAATNARRGLEVWSSDGTAAGTRLVADVFPGRRGSAPEWLVRLGDVVLFSASDGAHGRELWRTDGTAAGTRLVEDLRPGGKGSDPQRLVRIGDRVLFSASDGVHGRELWRTDGTAAGTRLVEDLYPGSTGSDPGRGDAITRAGRLAFFAAPADDERIRLWVSDGTARGTRRLGPTLAGDPDVDQLTDVDGTLFFATRSGGERHLWRTDGTRDGTRQVAAGDGFTDPRTMTAFGSRLLFSASHAVTGRELWISDGTTPGTRIVADLNPGPGSSATPFIVSSGAHAFFVRDPGAGDGLWATDGTAAGTSPVGSVPAEVTSVQRFRRGALFTTDGNDGTTTGDEALWRVGRGGISRLRSLIVCAEGPCDPWLAQVGGRQLFVADNRRDGDEPWTTDGTRAGTRPVADINRRGLGSDPRSFVRFDGRTFFIAWERVHGRDVRRSDGTPGTTRLLRDTRGLPDDDHGGFLARAAGRLWYTVDTEGREALRLVTSDGTRAGTRGLITIPGDHLEDAWATDPVAAGGRMFAVLNDHLVVSDGSVGGTSVLRDDVLSPLVAFEGHVYFVQHTAGAELWRTDGTPGGTVRVTDLPGTSYAPGAFVVMGGRFFFVTDDLWRSDGTAAGTRVVKDMAAGLSASATRLARVGDTLFFTTDEGDLWRSDGTARGTRAVFAAGDRRAPDPRELTPAGGLLYFTDYNSRAQHSDLWRSDGTAEGTRPVRDAAGRVVGDPRQMTRAGGRLFFTRKDAAHGRELWVTDGTRGGTRLVTDLRPGPTGSGIGRLTRAGSELWFSATAHTAQGAEPHRLPLSAVEAETSGATRAGGTFGS